MTVPETGRRHVILVESDKTVASLLTHVLFEYGWYVTAVVGSFSALEALAAEGISPEVRHILNNMEISGSRSVGSSQKINSWLYRTWGPKFSQEKPPIETAAFSEILGYALGELYRRQSNLQG
jgi:hypothetical protein